MSVATKQRWIPDPDITPAALETMRIDVMDRIIVARIGLLLRHPFFGNMATRLRIKAADDWLPTAAVDGRNLFFNTQFFNAMSNQEIEFVIAHEILHCVFDHLTRREDRDGQIYNIAADYIVNNLLVRDRIGTIPKLVDCYQDFKYDTWSSEEVYDDIFEQAKQNGDDFLNQLGELLDEHLDWEGDGEEDGNNNSNISSKQPKYSKEQMREIRDEVKENMMTAAQSSGAGNVPAEIERMISKLTEPKMNWREILRQQIQSTIRNDYTFMRPSRKGWHMSAILPGQNFDETIDIAVGIDMSGSIGNEQGEDFLGEVQGIMDEYQDYNIKVWCFDTKVYNEQDFTADGGERLEEYEIIGGGGTEFDCNWEYMKQHDITPKKFIMFTDGYPWGSWGDEDYCDTVFVIHSNRDRSLMAPFGLTTHYEDAA
ncbi:MAG: vWA domain-containing protein [Methylophagaceae bacterium]|jgi:predicted metal-dependent peptidase|tara:strand:- start:5096 stop:6373 length:1278 start_codon:yes stop_codon:yes gene_type:complete